MKIKLTLLLLITIGLMSLTSKEKEYLFKNESKLDSCKQEIPLTYKKKDDIIVAEKAKILKDKELILLHFNKKTNRVTFKRYFLVSEAKGNAIFNFLIPKKDYIANNKVAVFLKYTEKYDRFYLAECFDKILAENIDLKELLKEED